MYQKNNKRIYLGNLPPKTTKANLKKLFSKYGKIINLRISKDYFTKKNRNFAFIKLQNIASMKKAVSKLNESVYMKKTLICKLIKE